MPTYAYACTECGHNFEAVQSFSDDSLTECPQCTGRLRKVFSNVGIVFKGSGFYRTDSRAGAGDPAEAKGAKDGAGKDSGGSKDGGGKDRAPKEGAAKADTKSSGSTSAGTSSAPAAAKSGSSAGSAA